MYAREMVREQLWAKRCASRVLGRAAILNLMCMVSLVGHVVVVVELTTAGPEAHVVNAGDQE